MDGIVLGLLIPGLISGFTLVIALFLSQSSENRIMKRFDDIDAKLDSMDKKLDKLDDIITILKQIKEILKKK